ncbi:MAG: hypothetical protein ORN49_02435 [Rhodobacteraceae bacterium]|nr:hypothetical protein [Paracoccaceae bacterium]
MKLSQAFLLAGLASILGSTALSAADYYIQPKKAGPVAGAPLAAIAMQATKTTRLRSSVNQLGNETTAKWVAVTTTAVEKPASTTTPEPTTSTAATTAATPTAPATGNTYKTLADLVAAKKLVGGDHVYFQAGYHGMLTINGLNFTSPVTFSPAPNAVAHLEGISVNNASNLIFSDFKVWRTDPLLTFTDHVRAYAGSTDITFKNMDVRATADSVNYAKWDLATWTANKRNGIQMQGLRNSAIPCKPHFSGLTVGLFHSKILLPSRIRLC